MSAATNNYVIIMAGGVGSRFWPASRESRPKQFLDMLGVGRSLLQMTYDRFLRVTRKENIFILTNERYRDLVKEQLPELSDGQIMAEPSRNNTGPAVAYAAYRIQAIDPQASLVVAPSDHFIAQEADFAAVMQEGLHFVAAGDRILTLGMTPHRPDTGYGYIELGADATDSTTIRRAAAFREKPDLATAQAYLEAGSFVWNSGIFLFSVPTILKAFGRYAPQVAAILAEGEGLYNTADEARFLQERYPTTPNISIDYAIMEKADNVYCRPSDFGWSDLGTWASLHHFTETEGDDNVAIGCRVHGIDSSGNLVRCHQDKLIILKDVKDYMIVEEEDILLIYPLKDEQEIKKVSEIAKDLMTDA